MGAGDESLRMVQVAEGSSVADEHRAGLEQVAGRAGRQLGAPADVNRPVVDVDRRLLGGFARGVLQIEGSGEDASRTLRIDFQNENLIARLGDGEVLAVVPDLICLVDEDSADPVTTEIVRYGLRVVVLGIPAPAMLKSPEALRVIGPEAFGYGDVPFVPLPGVFGQSG